jgi:methylamine dehydrogenase accessory protein MauD
MFVASYIALWILAVFMLSGLVVLAHLLGILYQRVPGKPAKLGVAGPDIGARLQPVEYLDAFGRMVSVPPRSGKSLLLFFIAPSCSTCAQLLPVIKSLKHSERDELEVVLVSTNAEIAPAQDFLRRNGAEDVPLIASHLFLRIYKVFTSPYAIVFDHIGIVRAKGLVNTREHLESLFEAKDRAVAMAGSAPRTLGVSTGIGPA